MLNTSQGRQYTSREFDQVEGAAGLRGTTRPVAEEVARARIERDTKLNIAGKEGRVIIEGKDQCSKDCGGEGMCRSVFKDNREVLMTRNEI